MPFIQEDQPIRTLSTDCTGQSLAGRVRVRAPHRRCQHRRAHRDDRAIRGRGIDAVAVVNEEALRLIAGHNSRGTAGRSIRPWRAPCGIPDLPRVE